MQPTPREILLRQATEALRRLLIADILKSMPQKLNKQDNSVGARLMQTDPKASLPNQLPTHPKEAVPGPGWSQPISQETGGTPVDFHRSLMGLFNSLGEKKDMHRRAQQAENYLTKCLWALSQCTCECRELLSPQEEVEANQIAWKFGPEHYRVTAEEWYESKKESQAPLHKGVCERCKEPCDYTIWIMRHHNGGIRTCISCARQWKDDPENFQRLPKTFIERPPEEAGNAIELAVIVLLVLIPTIPIVHTIIDMMLRSLPAWQ